MMKLVFVLFLTRYNCTLWITEVIICYDANVNYTNNTTECVNIEILFRDRDLFDVVGVVGYGRNG